MGLHFFDISIAEEYGVNCAIIFQNLGFWIDKNEANERHFYDGRYWTYNSVKAFEKLFPYFSPKQISSILKKLEENDLIMSGNYNKSAYDRTKWYAFTDKGNRLYKNENSILPNGKMEELKKENGNAEKGEPIPYINTDISSNVKSDIKENTKRKETIPYQQIVDMYNDTCVSFPQLKVLSESRKKAIKARLNTYSIDDFKTLFEKAEASDFLKGKNSRDWSATFDWLLKDSNMAKVLDGNYDNKADKEKEYANSKAEEETKKQEQEEHERKLREHVKKLREMGY